MTAKRETRAQLLVRLGWVADGPGRYTNGTRTAQRDKPTSGKWTLWQSGQSQGSWSSITDLAQWCAEKDDNQ